MEFVLHKTSLSATAQFMPSPPAIPLLRNLIDQQGAFWLSLKLEPERPAAP
jgi:hypothetical protein